MQLNYDFGRDFYTDNAFVTEYQDFNGEILYFENRNFRL